MVLTLETYKGYNKLPYCDLHYPSVGHTTVAEAPANLNGGSQVKLILERNETAVSEQIVQNFAPSIEIK